MARLPTAAFDQRELFDDACAAAVRRHYACDFAAFGFSPRVADLLDPPGVSGEMLDPIGHLKARDGRERCDLYVKSTRR